MKILYITNGFTGSGGLERVLSVKASVLADDFSYNVHLLSLNEINKVPFFSFSKNVQFHSVTVGGNPISYFSQYKKKIQKIVDEIQPDIISVCDDALKGFLLPQIINTKAKWVHESHASMILGDKGKGVPLIKKLQHWLKQFLGNRFSKIVLLTQGNKKEWRLNNLEVIPNPLPFETAEMSTLHNKKIIAVGSHSYNKGYDLLLEIWSHIEKEFPDWELNVFGRGTYESLQSKAESLNLINIHFHNPVPNIEKRYLESSIFVLPSRSEGFGMVLIEAMSCGVPVISFDCPNGPKDIIIDGEDGFLVENGNVKEFANQIITLISCEELRNRMGQKAKQNVKRFAPEKITAQWDQLFKSLQIGQKFK